MLEFSVTINLNFRESNLGLCPERIQQCCSLFFILLNHKYMKNINNNNNNRYLIPFSLDSFSLSDFKAIILKYSHRPSDSINP
jgi:hypothetical protein